MTRSNTFRWASAAALSVLVAAASAKAQTPAPTPPPPTSQERIWSAGASKVGLFSSVVWATPRGTGVNIAIIDTGLLTSHQEFNSTGKLVGGYDAFSNRTGLAFVGDTAGHGTHVASLAAGEFDGVGMMGTAPGAGLYIAKVFQSGSTTDLYIQRGIAWANTTNAFVFNMSLGSSAPSPLIRSALQGSVAAGKLVVVAAGNEGAANPSWPARHASEAWAGGQIIAVGAVDANNVIASFSNRAGDARNFYIVAPGVNLIGAYPASNATYAYMSGTSMAAPVVAGAAATIKSNWKYLSARNVADILFASATDLGAKGVDPIYGRGLLNLEAALKPIGTVKTVTATGATTNRLSYASGIVTVGPLAAAAQDGMLLGAVFDDFGRDFQADLGEGLQKRFRPGGLDGLSASLNARLEAPLIVRRGATRIALAAAPAPFEGAEPGVSYLSTDAFGDALAYAFNAPSPLLGAQALEPAGGPRVARLGFATQEAFLGGERTNVALRRSLESGWSLTVGADQVDRRARVFTEFTAVPPKAVSLEAEAAWRGARSAAGFSLSTTRETGARLGETQRVLGFDGAAQTVTLRAQGALALDARTSVGVTASVARTGEQLGSVGSLARSAGATTSAGLAFGAARTDVFRRGDRLDLSVGTPLASVRGEMDVEFAVAADPETGVPLMQRRTLGLAGRTPEARVELAYARPSADGSAFGAALMLRNNADGVADAREAAVALRWKRVF